MILAGHSDTAYLNVSKAHSQAGAHIMLYKEVPVPNINGPILIIAQIITFVISSAAETELAGLFICAKTMVPLCQSLIKMGWPQAKPPIQCNNSTAVGVVNETNIPCKTKLMDM